jgi:hypothetical protein
LFQQASQILQTVTEFLLEEREEQILFAREVGVESSARVACSARNVLNPRCLKTIPGENLQGRFEQRPPRSFGSLLMLALFACLQGRNAHASYIIYMQVCI